MSVLARLAVARARRRTIALALALALFELLVGLSYASVDENQVRRLVESLPPALKALIAGADVASPAGYVGAGFLHPVALTILAALAISVASAPARDVEQGVAELLLARPVPPWRWMAAQAAAMTVLVAVVAAAGLAGSAVAVATVADLAPVAYAGLVLVAANGVLLALAIGGVTLVAASLSRTGGRAVGWGAGFALASYALNYLAQVWTAVEPVGRLSVFRYFRPADVLTDVALPARDALVLGLVATAATAAALWLTDRRELAP